MHLQLGELLYTVEKLIFVGNLKSKAASEVNQQHVNIQQVNLNPISLVNWFGYKKVNTGNFFKHGTKPLYYSSCYKNITINFHKIYSGIEKYPTIS